MLVEPNGGVVQEGVTGPAIETGPVKIGLVGGRGDCMCG